MCTFIAIVAIAVSASIGALVVAIVAAARGN